MKKIILLVAAAVFTLASCTDYQPSIDELQNQIDELKSGNSKLNETVSGLQKVAEALQSGDQAISIKPITSNNEIQGYTVTFAEAGAVTVYNATANVTVAADGGQYYWKVDGEWLKDAQGNKIPVVSESVTPQFKIEKDTLMVSVDNCKSWESVGAVAKPVIEKVEDFVNKVVITLAGGTAIEIPKVAELCVAFTSPAEISAGQSADYTYTITGGSDDTQVKTFAKDGWKAVVSAESAAQGTITVTAPTPFAPVNVLVFVSDGKGRTVVAELPAVTKGDDPEEPGEEEEQEDPTLAALVNAYTVGSEGGDVEVLISTNLQYTVTSDEDWAYYSSTKAMRQDTVVIRVEANTAQKSREATITFESGEYFTTVAIVQDAAPEPEAGPNLSEFGTANCYIVTKAGSYYFNAKVMGCGQSGIVEDEAARFHTSDATLEKPKNAEVLINQNDVVSDVKFEDGNIKFTASGKAGNALIAVTNKQDDILWSWHIWCTPEVKDVTVISTDFDETEYEMMDRNLGSTSTDPTDLMGTYGAYYQWGRKDPFFPQADFASLIKVNEGASIQYSIENPTLFFKSDPMMCRTLEWYNLRLASISYWLWGNPDPSYNSPSDLVKTIYDPCPVGYMMPPAEVMDYLATCKMEFIDQGVYITIDGEKVYFPYGGILSQQDSHGYDTHDGWYTNYGDTDSASQIDGGWGIHCRLQTSTTRDFDKNWGGSGDRLSPAQFTILKLYSTQDPLVEPRFGGGFRTQGLNVRCVRIPESEDE